jgi:hypothetical protein
MGTAVELYRQYGFLDVPAEPMPEVEGLLNMELVIAA